jgi:hypothetical protein
LVDRKEKVLCLKNFFKLSLHRLLRFRQNNQTILQEDKVKSNLLVILLQNNYGMLRPVPTNHNLFLLLMDTVL